MLILVLFAIKAMASKTTSFGGIVFTSGMSMIPLGIVALIVLAIAFADDKTFAKWLSSPETVGHVGFILFVLISSSFILLLKASLVSVLGIGRAAAFWLVPIVIITVWYLSYWTNLGLNEVFK